MANINPRDVGACAMCNIMLTQLDFGWQGEKWPIALCKNLKLSYLDRERISHKTNNFIARFTHIMNIYIFTFTPGRPTGEILMEQTDRRTDKVTTITLAAHARQGLNHMGIKSINIRKGWKWEQTLHFLQRQCHCIHECIEVTAIPSWETELEVTSAGHCKLMLRIKEKCNCKLFAEAHWKNPISASEKHKHVRNNTADASFYKEKT